MEAPPQRASHRQRFATSGLARQLTVASEKHGQGSAGEHPAGGFRHAVSAPLWTQTALLESGQEQEELARGVVVPDPASKHHPAGQSEPALHGRVFGIQRQRASPAQAAASRLPAQTVARSACVVGLPAPFAAQAQQAATAIAMLARIWPPGEE